MRTRSQKSSVPLTGQYSSVEASKVQNSPVMDFPSPVLKNSVGSTVDTSKTCVDDVTAGYFGLARRGKHLPVNRLNISKADVVGKGCQGSLKLGYAIQSSATSWTVRRASYELTACIPLSLPSMPKPSFNQAAMVQSAVAKMRSQLWDVGTFLAEFAKTVELIARAKKRAILRMTEIMSALSKRRWKSVSELLDAFFQMWMEGRYGWRLLYYDLLDAQKAYQKLKGNVEGISKRYTVTEDTQNTNTTAWQAVSTSCWQARWTTDDSIVGRAGCMGHIGLSDIISIDPIVTGWEVIPFSFVSDWFFNVGEALQAWSPLATGQLDHAFFSTKITSVSTCEIRVNPNFTFQGRLWSACDIVNSNPKSDLYIVRKSVERVPFTPTFDLSFRPNLSVGKIVDGIALTWLLRRHLASVLRLIK